jgi:hypothetical protein
MPFCTFFKEIQESSPKRAGPKAFRSTMHDTRFLKHFRASSNVIKYNGKTNTSIWLDDYRLACKAGRADDYFSSSSSSSFAWLIPMGPGWIIC